MFALLFVGVLNKSYEYNEPEICLKYPTLKMVFVKPDLPDNYKTDALSISVTNNLNSYNKVYNINEKLGEVGKAIAVILLQLFLTFLFIKNFKEYKISYLIFDVVFFIISAICLFVFLELFKLNILLIASLILIFNLFLNYFLRNFFFNKL